MQSLLRMIHIVRRMKAWFDNGNIMFAYIIRSTSLFFIRTYATVQPINALDEASNNAADHSTK